jgi:hypothetical protein
MSRLSCRLRASDVRDVRLGSLRAFAILAVACLGSRAQDVAGPPSASADAAFRAETPDDELARLAEGLRHVPDSIDGDSRLREATAELAAFRFLRHVDPRTLPGWSAIADAANAALAQPGSWTRLPDDGVIGVTEASDAAHKALLLELAGHAAQADELLAPGCIGVDHCCTWDWMSQTNLLNAAHGEIELLRGHAPAAVQPLLRAVANDVLCPGQDRSAEEQPWLLALCGLASIESGSSELGHDLVRAMCSEHPTSAAARAVAACLTPDVTYPPRSLESICLSGWGAPAESALLLGDQATGKWRLVELQLCAFEQSPSLDEAAMESMPDTIYYDDSTGFVAALAHLEGHLNLPSWPWDIERIPVLWVMHVIASEHGDASAAADDVSLLQSRRLAKAFQDRPLTNATPQELLFEDTLARRMIGDGPTLPLANERTPARIRSDWIDWLSSR